MTLSLHHLTCTLGSTLALSDVTAHVEAPALLGLQGPNGAGKSTLLRVLASRIWPTSGHANVCGVDTRHPDAQQHVAFLPETPALPGEMTTQEYMTWVARTHRTPLPDTWPQTTGLSSLWTAHIQNMSRGQRQRVALAASLLRAPSILLLDEPFSGLDTQERKLWCTLLQNHAQTGIVIISSHEHGLLDTLTPRRWVMDAGRLTESQPNA